MLYEVITVHDPDHRIIDPGDDLTVMEEKKIGQSCQALQGIFVVRTDRLAAPVAAGHHQHLRNFRLTEQQKMQRGVGQHVITSYSIHYTKLYDFDAKLK